MKTPELSSLMSDYLITFWSKKQLEEYSALLLYKTAKENHYIFAGFCLHYAISLVDFNQMTKGLFDKESFWEEVDNNIMEYLTEPAIH